MDPMSCMSVYLIQDKYNRFSITISSGGEGVISLFFLSHASFPTLHVGGQGQATLGDIGIMKGANLYLAKRGSDNTTSSFL